MKKILAFALIISTLHLSAQDKSTDQIKLFVDLPGENIAALNTAQKDRLLMKVTQLVNQSGVAEIGYSNFLVYPKFNVLDVQLSEAGIQKVYLAKCELGLFISRTSFPDASGKYKISAVYSSRSFKVSGSGYTKDEAINNAVTNISVDNEDMVAFINESKQKIVDYFNTNCANVIKEADQAKELKAYAKAISLYFSIPTSAPCYEEAKGRSIGVYNSYMENECRKDMIKLKAMLALGTPNYKDALAVFSGFEPGTQCYKEAEKMLVAVENKFSEEDKRQWQYIMNEQKNTNNLQQQMIKKMTYISATYRPAY